MTRLPHIPRVLARGAVGPDVVAMKRALQRLHYRKRFLGQSRRFGAKLEAEVKHFQHDHGLHPDGVIGQHTYAKLRPTILRDGYAVWLLRHTVVKAPADELRDQVVHWALWGVQHAYLFRYAQIRPIPLTVSTASISNGHYVWTDCSGFVGMVYHWAGAPSPFGALGYSGAGNTDTILGAGKHIASPGRGDLVLYGSPGHVVICLGGSRAVSFGSDPGPYALSSYFYRTPVAYRSFL